MLNLAWPCQQFIGGQPLSNESMNINLDIDNLDFIHLDFHHLETLVHKLPNSQNPSFISMEIYRTTCTKQQEKNLVICIARNHFYFLQLSFLPPDAGCCQINVSPVLVMTRHTMTR